MPRKETRTLYTLREIQKHFPDSFAKIHERWREHVARFETPWSDETMDSLKAVCKLFGKLRDWSIGPDSPSHLRIDLFDRGEFDDDGNDNTPTDAQIVQEAFGKAFPDRWTDPAKWAEFRGHATGKYSALRRLAQRLPENMSDDAIAFNGTCPSTGYCADDTFAEYVYWAVRTGYSTLKEALEECAGIASTLMEWDQEQQEEADSMLANWGDNEYTEDGEEA